MNRDDFSQWLDRFGEAWQTNNPAAIGRLVPDSCEWHAGPFAEVFRDRQTLVDHWVGTVNTHDDIKTSYEILAVDDGLGICRYRASYIRLKTARVEDDMIFLVRLNEQGECVEFREWYAGSSTPLPAYA